MARYLIVQEKEILDDVEASSLKAAVEGLEVEGNGAFHVYTVTSSRVVEFHTVTETKLVFPGDKGSGDEGDTDSNVVEEE